jgi:hypothetical protein
MSSTIELSSFAARMRGIIATFRCDPAADISQFEQFALELFALQFRHNVAYRRVCEARGARPGKVTHWTAIPGAPTSAFKAFDLSCLSVPERTTVFNSSGTTVGRPSRHFHSADSLALYEASSLAWFEMNFQSAIRDSQLAILTPSPAETPRSSLVHMFNTIRRRVGSGASAFLGRAVEDGTWTLNPEEVVEALLKAGDSKLPLLLLGTAFSYVHLLDYLAQSELCLALPPGSCALETGGYKGRSRSLPKTALHALISQRLGIPASRIVCEYGMSELSSQAYDVRLGESTQENSSRVFRFPPWARAQVISPESGREVGEGQTGLIRVLDLANVFSVMAVQTEDLGIRRGDGFDLVGRAASAEPRGCSLNSGLGDLFLGSSRPVLRSSTVEGGREDAQISRTSSNNQSLLTSAATS